MRQEPRKREDTETQGRGTVEKLIPYYTELASIGRMIRPGLAVSLGAAFQVPVRVVQKDMATYLCRSVAQRANTDEEVHSTTSKPKMEWRWRMRMFFSVLCWIRRLLVLICSFPLEVLFEYNVNSNSASKTKRLVDYSMW